MKALPLVSLLAIPCLAFVSAAGGAGGPKQPEEYAVWSAVLTYSYPAGASRQLVIENQTVAVPERPAPNGAQRNHSYSEIEVIDDASRQSSYTLEKKFTLGLPYVLVPKNEQPQEAVIDSVGQANKDNVAKVQNEWDQFHKKYPGAYGIVGLSRVGFLNHGTQAAVIVVSREGILGSGGKLYFLSKKNGSWEVETVTPLNND
jgi:hypothetical protein